LTRLDTDRSAPSWSAGPAEPRVSRQRQYPSVARKPPRESRSGYRFVRAAEIHRRCVRSPYAAEAVAAIGEVLDDICDTCPECD
jgi:hypothetical protein